MCRKQIFSQWPETPRNILEKIIKILAKDEDQGAHTLFTRVGGAPPREHPLPRGPPGGPPTPTPTPYIGFRGGKNKGEEIIEFYDTDPPPSPNLSRDGWSGVCSGLRRGESIAIVIINHPPSPVWWCSPPCVSNSFIGSLVSLELDEIHHLIELVLLGLDP